MLEEITVWKDEYMVLEKTLSKERLVNKLENTIKSGNTWYVWKEDNEYKAWIIVHWNGKKTQPGYPDLLKLIVREDCLRQGIATKLISACEAQAVKRGYNKIGLSVSPKNIPAIRLYEKLGYSRIGEIYEFGIKHTPVFDMIKHL